MSQRRPAPVWVRTLDALSLLLAFAAAIVAVSGGFRAHLGSLRIAVTSPVPLIAWCVGITAVRHIAAPQQPLYREFPQRLAEWSRLPAIRTAAAAVFGTRVVMFIVGYLAVFMFGFANGRAPLRHFNNELLNLPVRWDAGWYLQIVTDGYKYAPADPSIQQNIVFFPAYPMLVRVVGRLFGGDMIGYVAAGTIISIVSFFGALVYLYAFARDRYGDDVASGSIWLLAAYPFALFFGALYTESLFLLGTLGALYHFSRQEFGRAACWGLLVGLTRLNGSLLALPLALLAITSSSPRLKMPALAAAAAPVAGLVIYALFIWSLTGNPLAFASGQMAWGRTYTGLGALVSQQYSILANAGLSGYVGTPGYDALNAMGALFAVATIWPVARRLGMAYGLFMVINILPALANGGLLSVGRFSSVLFPAFIWLATIVPSSHRAAWIATFAAVQAFGAALFYTWRPLF
ncbi:MAG TPA: mannosyltransferase family protein [Vicinamibacterales bacterium]|nr:mannosyltransferase family protein [Vicinamibacterales bacterium]